MCFGYRTSQIQSAGKIMRAFAIILANFLWFVCQFLSWSFLSWFFLSWSLVIDKYLFHKTALGISFLAGIISSVRIILLPTVL